MSETGVARYIKARVTLVHSKERPGRILAPIVRKLQGRLHPGSLYPHFLFFIIFQGSPNLPHTNKLRMQTMELGRMMDAAFYP